MTDLELISTFESRLNGTKQVIFRELSRRFKSKDSRLKVSELAKLLRNDNLRDPLSELRREFEEHCRKHGYPHGTITRTYIEISLGDRPPVEEKPDARDLFWGAHRSVGPAIAFSYTEALMFREREMRALIRFLDVNGHDGDGPLQTGSFLIRRSEGRYVARILAPGSKDEALVELASDAAKDSPEDRDDAAAETGNPREIWSRQKDNSKLVIHPLWPFRGYVSSGETEFLLHISHAISRWADARFAQSHREQAFDMPADGSLIALGNARTHTTIRTALGWSEQVLAEHDPPLYPYRHFPFRVDRNGIVKVNANGSALEVQHEWDDFSVRDDGCFSIYGLISRMRAPGTQRPMTLIIGNHSATFSAISRFLLDNASMQELLASIQGDGDGFPQEYQVLIEAAIRRNDESLIADRPKVIDYSVARR